MVAYPPGRPRRSRGPSLPEYAFTKSLGNPDQANHAPDENLELERFFRGIRTAAAILRELGTDDVESARSCAPNA
jgi:hypothetical protein